MTDTIDNAPVTKQDILEQNTNKVFAKGFAADTEEISMLPARRPAFGIDAKEFDAAKVMGGDSPFTPVWMKGNVTSAWHVIQLSKQWTDFDERTNSWIHFSPGMIAQNIYVVRSEKGGESVGYTSQFIGALLDAFVPWGKRMRYRYDGEGEERRCTAVGILRGDPEPFEYTTPPYRLITPKRSPLWQSDPDRQLAYYARRAWARLYTPGVLLGVYDVDELEGQTVHRTRDMGVLPEATAGLHDRLAAAGAAGATGEGFRPGLIEGASQEPQGAAEGPPPSPPTGRRGKRTSARAPGGDRPSKRPPKAAAPRKALEEPGRTRSLTNPKHLPDAKAVKAVADRAEAKIIQPPPAKIPVNAKAYRKHVEAWLDEYETEQDIEARWRSEMRLRNQCGVIEEERASIRTLIDQRIQQVRK